MNIFTGIGRLTADPEIRQTQTGLTVASYTLAIDRYSKDKDKEADFLRCKCFGKTADFAAHHLFKGTKIGVVGSVRTGSYTDNNGKTVYTTDIIVNEHTFCEKSQGGGQYQQYQTTAQPLPETLNDFEEVVSDGDLPF
jgi:single-strand DNA-binding protein